MTVWLDAHLSPALAPWLAATFGVTATAVRDLGLRDALDPPIFDAARSAGAVVMTKDADFAEMVGRLGTPPQVIWLRCGNTSNAALRTLLSAELPAALVQLAAGVRSSRSGRRENPGADAPGSPVPLSPTSPGRARTGAAGRRASAAPAR